MNQKDIQYFKNKLEKEKILLEEELNSVGNENPENPGDWNATPGNIEVDSADENEVADKMEELGQHRAILRQLEPQLIEVASALRRIEDGKFGICEICSGTIEKERLEANPSAKTCMKDMNGAAK